MGDAPGETPLVATCPNCQKAYAVHAEQNGKTARCRQCGQPFIIDAQPPGAPPAPPSAAGAPGAPLCPICQSPPAPGEPTTVCPVCKTIHHTDCWEYNKGCGLYGCTQAPETEKLQEIEIPASYWGQTEKRCPRCNNVIQAAAVRCRHCGTTFETARPQDVQEFTAQTNQKAAIHVHRRIGIALLILGIIPCCAPVVAVGGLIWYFVARREIAAMPPLYATICRLAVAISVAVTLFIILAAVLHAALS